MLSLDQIKEIFKQELSEDVISTERFTTGFHHYVYDVKTTNNNYVLRVAKDDDKIYLKGGSYWLKKLYNMGINVPKFICFNNYDKNISYMIIERLQGTDICNVYDTLTKYDKHLIIKELISIQ